MAGKNINLFLIDGEPSGRMKCSLLNWTGVGYKIPRTQIQESTDISYLQQSGVYFLFGTENGNKPVVYIGQAGVRKNKKGLLGRIMEPHGAIDYWSEAVMFTTANDSFGPTEISYLEHRFCNMALEAKRYEVKNSNDPNPGHLTEEKISEMEEFISYAEIVTGVLGYKVFEPVITQKEKADEPVFIFQGASLEAYAQRSSEGFVLLAGSHIKAKTTGSCPESTLKERKKYEQITADNITSEDILFSSPSAAAAFVAGSSASGNVMWKTEDNKSPKDLC